MSALGRLFRRRSGAPPALRLLTRPGCHLCEEMKASVVPLVARLGGTLSEVDVDSDPALSERFGNEIPVLLDADGRVVAKLRDPVARIERRLGARRASLTGRRSGLVLLFLLARAASADSDGYFCISDGYFAFELREWSTPERKHVLKILLVGGPEGISAPRTVPLDDFQLHGMKCEPHGIVLLSRERKYTIGLAGHEPPRVTSAESFPAGRIPEGHDAKSLAAFRQSRSFDVPSKRTDRSYELRISYLENRAGPGRTGVILHETTSALIERDEGGRVLRERLVHKGVRKETVD